MDDQHAQRGQRQQADAGYDVKQPRQLDHRHHRPQQAHFEHAPRPQAFQAAHAQGKAGGALARQGEA
ncbi:hypothetical protein D3C75_1225040 [compost metagenome]